MSGQMDTGQTRRERIYTSGTGKEALHAAAIAGDSPETHKRSAAKQFASALRDSNHYAARLFNRLFFMSGIRIAGDEPAFAEDTKCA